MQMSIRLLIEYLTEHNFEHPISPKILTRPAVKDFTNIVMFLFKQIDSNMNCMGRFEDEVVSIFKYLGYPTQISKSNLAAVGSPHAWPSLLASIMWLVELLAYDEASARGAADQLEVDVEDATSDKAFTSYISTSYGLFLSGEDYKYEQMEREFKGSFESKIVDLNSQVNDMERRNAALLAEIRDVENRRAHLPELEAKKREYEKDMGKFQQLVEQLLLHKEQLKNKTEERKIQQEKLAVITGAAHQENNGLRERIANQELSPEDVKNMVSERERLEEALEQASEHRQALQRKVWEGETALRDRVQALEDSSRAYNTTAEDLKMIPHTARNARGRHLAVEVDARAKKRTGLLKTDVTLIVPVLQEERVNLGKQTARLRSDLLTEQDAAEEVDQKRAEFEEQRAAIDAKLSRSEESYRREKEALDQALESP